MAEIFTHRFTVPASAIDAMNHVNNVTYLQWCLDAAEAHWKHRAPDSLRSQFVWVVLNHFIEYRNPAFEGEELEIQTWVTMAEGVKSERCYKITRPGDGKLMVEAKTLWCLLDANTHRPAKINEEIRTLFQ